MTQTERLLAALKTGPITKVQSLRELGILNTGGRIQDLRDAGHNIKTDMIEVRTRRGISTVASYRLVKGKRK